MVAINSLSVITKIWGEIRNYKTVKQDGQHLVFGFLKTKKFSTIKTANTLFRALMPFLFQSCHAFSFPARDLGYNNLQKFPTFMTIYKISIPRNFMRWSIPLALYILLISVQHTKNTYLKKHGWLNSEGLHFCL